jgi:hypothetical protein
VIERSFISHFAQARTALMRRGGKQQVLGEITDPVKSVNFWTASVKRAEEKLQEQVACLEAVAQENHCAAQRERVLLELLLTQDRLQLTWEKQQRWLQPGVMEGSSTISESVPEIQKWSSKTHSDAESDDISSSSIRSGSPSDSSNNDNPFVDGDFVLQVLESATPVHLRMAMSSSAGDCK